jgi:hypothetical protein
MIIPDESTPEVYDYLWIYTVLRRYLPKDIICLIIGERNNRKIWYAPLDGCYEETCLGATRILENFSLPLILGYQEWKIKVNKIKKRNRAQMN